MLMLVFYVLSWLSRPFYRTLQRLKLILRIVRCRRYWNLLVRPIADFVFFDDSMWICCIKSKPARLNLYFLLVVVFVNL